MTQTEGMKAYVENQFRRELRRAGITEGLIAEIGGPKNSFAAHFPEFRFEFLSLFPVQDNPAVRVADICDCPQIETERYDAVFSISVFEHVARPWAAGAEIERILKPGGVAFHVAPFSYFYHKAPEDYWRFTPAAFQSIFGGLRQVRGEFYGRNRRRDNRGSAKNPVDKDGGAQFAVDDLGGWRENWHSLYVGRKPTLEQGAREVDRRRNAVIVDLVKVLIEKGKDEPFGEVADVVSRLSVDGGLGAGDAAQAVSPDDVADVWKRRPGRVSPRASRFALAAKLGLL